MPLYNSEDVFSDRAKAMGLSDLIPAMKTRGWTTPGAYGFSSAYVPGAPDDTSFIERVVLPLVGSETDARVPALRMLHAECYTLAVAEMQRRITGNPTGETESVPRAERKARRDKTAARLAGLHIHGQAEPAHSLEDAVARMAEDNTARYIPWADCLSREEELTTEEGDNRSKRAKTSKAMMTDDKGFVKMVVDEGAATADYSKSGLLNFILTRRGVALDEYDVMSYMAHDKIRQRLMSELLDEPVDPRFEGPSLEQLKRADAYIFRALAADCQGGIRRDSNGNLPLGEAIDKVLCSHRLTLILAGNRKGGASAGSQEDRPKSEDKDNTNGETKGQKKRRLLKQKKRGITAPIKQSRTRQGHPRRGQQTSHPGCRGS